MSSGERSNSKSMLALGIIGLFGVVTFALTATILGTMNKKYDYLNDQLNNILNQLTNLNSILPTTTAITSGIADVTAAMLVNGTTNQNNA